MFTEKYIYKLYIKMLKFMKRVNITLDEETHTKAKIISLLKNLTLNEYFKGIIEDAVAKDEHIIREELPEKVNLKSRSRKQANRQA